MTPDRCYAPNVKYKPEWAKRTPDGFRDETFLVPFQFLQVPGSGQIVRGLPWNLDDDQPFILDGIFFTQIGTTLDANGGQPSGQGLARIWDCQGNPLSQGLVLGLGMWGNGSIALTAVGSPAQVFGWGFPIEDELECPPGGTLLFDFQLTTTATVAFFQIVDVVLTITFYAGVWGAAGNGGVITLVDPGAPNIPLSLVVAGANVTVTLATDGAGVVTSTFQDIADIVNAQAGGVMIAIVTLT